MKHGYEFEEAVLKFKEKMESFNTAAELCRAASGN